VTANEPLDDVVQIAEVIAALDVAPQDVSALAEAPGAWRARRGP
jgi:hypothetical protein